MTTVRLASIVYYTLPYQGVGVSGDAVELVYVPTWFITTSVGTGPTNNGATIPSIYGDAITPKLPRGTALADTALTRSSCAQGIYTLTSNGLMRHQWVSSGDFSPMAPGISITLDATTGTNGRQAHSDRVYNIVGYNMASSIFRLCAIPMIGKVTAVGTGSVLTVGQLVLVAQSNNYSGVASAVQNISIVSSNANNICDFFALP
jgi:hypothetical protein